MLFVALVLTALFLLSNVRMECEQGKTPWASVNSAHLESNTQWGFHILTKLILLLKFFTFIHMGSVPACTTAHT